MDKRTRTDFSKHTLDVIENEHVVVHKLHLNNSSMHRVVFINCQGILSVTGDFGNWVFAREFHPSSDGYVSDSYWNEKLRMHSVQTSSEYNADVTIEEINEYRKEYLDANDNKTKEWLDELENITDDELEYTYHAYREKPYDVDYEYVPFGKFQHTRLSIIYDAFDEICNRLK